MKVKEAQETLKVEVDGLKYKTVPMIYDGNNFIVIPDEEVQFLNKGNRKERKTNAKIFNKKYGIERSRK